MKNEFGEALDRNGYAPAIWGDFSFCPLCGKNSEVLQRHEVFHNDFGGKTRDKAKAYGLWLNVCPKCHDDIHHFPLKNAELKRYYQKLAMAKYNWTEDDWRKRFGKSYLWE